MLGDIGNPAALAENLMSNARHLREAVLTIRETIRIVAARGVKLKHYAGEIWPYKIPSYIAGIAMKQLFKSNELTRRIMLLHNDFSDILYGCSCLYETGQSLNVKTPLFSSKYRLIANRMDRE